MSKAPVQFVWALMCVLSISLSACSGMGPRGRDLISEGRSEDASFALVEITDENIEMVARYHHASLGAVFGDYRAPRIQRIGAGDTVQIVIWEASTGGPRASSVPEQIVSRDGTVNVPFVGRINVSGKTAQEVEELVVNKMKGRASEPQALVTVGRAASYAVTVTGDVTSGARVPLSTRGDRILDVIAQVGGVKAPVHETFISITRAGSTLSVPMQTLLSTPAENIYLRPDDVVTVVRMPQSFTAVGATGRQAVVPFEQAGLTLEEAVGKSGGLLDDRADPSGVFVLRFEPVELVRTYPGIAPRLLTGSIVAIVYHINMRDPSGLFRARRFAMRDKDILYVSNAANAELEKIARIFNTVTQPAAISASAVINAMP